MKLIFYYQGKKAPSKGYDVASGCLMIIALSALIYFFTLVDSIEDIEEHWFQLLFILLMAGSMIFQLFRKKGKLHTNKIILKNGYLTMNTVVADLETIQLDIYTFKEKLERYHLWDAEGKIAIYSTHEDDLATHFKTYFPTKVTYHQIINGSSSDFEYTITTKEGRLAYHLETGGFKIIKNNKEVVSFVPETFTIDGKFKKGLGLTK